MIGFETNRLALASAGVLSLFYSKQAYKKSLAHSPGFFSTILIAVKIIERLRPYYGHSVWLDT